MKEMMAELAASPPSVHVLFWFSTLPVVASLIFVLWAVGTYCWESWKIEHPKEPTS